VLEALLFPAIRWGSVGPLLLISLAIMGSPGPATISLIAAGSVYGVRRSLPYLAGIIVGTTIVLVAVATGITAALLAVPAIGSILIGISAAYGRSTPRHCQPEGLGRDRRGLRQRPPRRFPDNGRRRQDRGADCDDHRDLRDVAVRRHINRAGSSRSTASPRRQRRARCGARRRDRARSLSLRPSARVAGSFKTTVIYTPSV